MNETQTQTVGVENVEWVTVKERVVTSFIRFKSTDKGTRFSIGKGFKDIVSKNDNKFLSIGVSNGKVYGKLNKNGDGFELINSKGEFKNDYSASNLVEILKEKGITLLLDTRLPVTVVVEGDETIIEINIPTVDNKTAPKTTAKK